MSLEMRTECERCETALTDEGLAFICSYESTFCVRCAAEMDLVCSSCGGELVELPERLPQG
jgi:hypothetical protein